MGDFVRGSLKLRIFTALFFFSALQTMLAQPTWHGLNFGMSEAEVTRSLMDYKLKPDHAAALDPSMSSLGSTVDYHLKASGSTLPIPFTISAFFTGKRKLDSLFLTLDLVGLKREKPDGFDSSDEAIYVINMVLFKDLTGKYGNPARQEGECGDMVEGYGRGRIATCHYYWSVKSQEIEYYWAVGGSSERTLWIKYGKLNSDL
jgi:hypothetical protein